MYRELQRAFLNRAVIQWWPSSLDSVSTWATAQDQFFVDAEAAYASSAASSDHPALPASTDKLIGRTLHSSIVHEDRSLVFLGPAGRWRGSWGVQIPADKAEADIIDRRTTDVGRSSTSLHSAHG